MLGMEMMIANMLGLKPEQLKEAADKFVKGVEAVAKDIAEIKQGIGDLKLEMEALKNERATGSDSGSNNATRKRGSGNGNSADSDRGSVTL